MFFPGSTRVTDRFLIHSFLYLLILIMLCSCTKKEASAPDSTNKISVVTTLFPLYDFSRKIGGDKVQVALLLPPGMEAHGFQPKPDDAIRVSRADVFIYTNKLMEPWAVKFADNLASAKLLLVDSSSGVTFLKGGAGAAHDSEHEHDGKSRGGGMDPHIWLDFANAKIMVHNIAAAFIAKDPANSSYYSANEAVLIADLKSLDDAFKSGLSNCRKSTFLHGGHYTFGYLAHRYGLHYESASAVNVDAEPTATNVINLLKKVKSLGLNHVYSEEMLSPKVSEMIAREAGVSILMLHGAHNISKDDFNAGMTFDLLMRKNLDNLKTGLQCR